VNSLRSSKSSATTRRLKCEAVRERAWELVLALRNHQTLEAELILEAFASTLAGGVSELSQEITTKEDSNVQSSEASRRGHVGQESC
jgi:hypothetical protein